MQQCIYKPYSDKLYMQGITNQKRILLKANKKKDPINM